MLVVDAAGENLERPTLSIVVDTYSRCIMGMHLGFAPPSAAVVCLALRHAILETIQWSLYLTPRQLMYLEVMEKDYGVSCDT